MKFLFTKATCDTTANKVIVLKITDTAIGQPCAQGGSSDQCSDPKSACILNDDGNYRCLCNSGYYVYSDTCTASKYIVKTKIVVVK